MPFQGFTMPPPYGGLDLVSPIDNTEPYFATELINVFPGAGAPTVRLGYTKFVDAGTTALKFVDTVNLNDGTSRLIASNDTTIYGITTGASVSTITGSAVTSGQWQSTTYNNRIYLCNGVDNARQWNGSAATTSDLTFTGLALTSMVDVHAHKERLYFVEINSCKVWYGGLQVTGTGGTPALTSFDFSYVFPRGGFLVGIGSYSNSNNVAAQDYFWACSSEGDIVFYSGTYAGDPSTWGLIARFYIGKPVGRRAFISVNNDIWIITEQGIVPISGLFQADPEAALNIISQKINPLISSYANQFPFDHKWSGFFWPQGRRVYINVPIDGLSTFFIVYSIDTKAWTEFLLYDDSHALSNCLFNKLPYYASSTGVIWKGETGYADAVSGGTSQAINYVGKTAFNFYGSRSNYKAFKDIRPILKAKKGAQINIGLDVDFRRGSVVPTITPTPGVFTPWGSPWGSPWSSSEEYIFDRYAVKGQGHCASVVFSGAVKNTTMQILGFEVRYDLGGQV